LRGVFNTPSPIARVRCEWRYCRGWRNMPLLNNQLILISLTAILLRSPRLVRRDTAFSDQLRFIIQYYLCISGLLFLFYRCCSLLRAPQDARPSRPQLRSPSNTSRNPGARGISRHLRIVAAQWAAGDRQEGPGFAGLLARLPPRASKQPRRRVFLRFSERTVVLCHLEVVILHLA
jgi:hypothetical protein